MVTTMILKKRGMKDTQIFTMAFMMIFIINLPMNGKIMKLGSTGCYVLVGFLALSIGML